jgi:hypothetical protein
VSDDRDTITAKVDSRFPPRGPDGNVSRLSGISTSAISLGMRPWIRRPAGDPPPHAHAPDEREGASS